jgi:hypothetical protein
VTSDARQKNVFGGRGFLRGKRTFLIVWHDGLVVKTPRNEYAAALKLRGVTAFAPDDVKLVPGVRRRAAQREGICGDSSHLP